MTRAEIAYAQDLAERIDKLRTQLAGIETSETFGIYTLGKGQHDDEANLIDCGDLDGIDMRSIAEAAFEYRIATLERDLSAFNPKAPKCPTTLKTPWTLSKNTPSQCLPSLSVVSFFT